VSVEKAWAGYEYPVQNNKTVLHEDIHTLPTPFPQTAYLNFSNKFFID